MTCPVRPRSVSLLDVVRNSIVKRAAGFYKADYPQKAKCDMACCEANANNRPCQCHLRNEAKSVNQCSREPYASEVLERRIAELRDEASQLEQLLEAMPRSLPHHANRAMLRLLCQSK